MKNLISMRDLSKEEILHLMDVAGKIEAGEIVPDMQRKLAALLFFEPSTRTMFSFSTLHAVMRTECARRMRGL